MWRFLLILTILVSFALLNIEFPYALHDRDDRYRALYFLMLLLAVVAARRSPRWQQAPMLRNAIIWAGIILTLLFAYSFKDELENSRIAGVLFPRHIQISGDKAMQIHASAEGGFFIEGEVNHTPVLFMIDTGASEIVLSPDDATRAGLSPEHLEYNRSYSTANGMGLGAAVTLDTLTIGTVSLSLVPASVNKTEMKTSLLGMSFLHQLKSFRFQGDTLILTP